MPKIKFDVSGSDPNKAIQDSEPPKPGVYRCKVDEINAGFTKGEDGKPDKTRPRLEVIYRITVGKSKGAPLWDYVSFSEAAQWKLDQFLQAMGIATAKKRKGEFDTAKLIGKVVKVRVVKDPNSEDYRPKVKGVFAPGEDDEDEDGADEEEVDEDDEEEEDDEDDTEDEDDEESSVDPDHPMMKLGAEADAGGRPGKAAEKKLKTAAAEADLDPDEYDSWTALAEALVEAEDEDEDEDEDSEEEDDGYDELTPVALKKELKERGLKTAGTKEALIARLRENDGQEDPF